MWGLGSWLSLWISWGPGLGNPVSWEGTGGVRDTADSAGRTVG